jgi:hypothetical protein
MGLCLQNLANARFSAPNPSCKGNTFPLDPLKKMEAKMKRTPSSGDENRDAVFRFRITKAEKQLMKSLAKNYGFKSISKYLRSLIPANNQSTALDRQTLLLLQAELGKEGSNLNQIAKAINIRLLKGEPININPNVLNTTLENIDSLTHQLLEILKNVRFRKNPG